MRAWGGAKREFNLTLNILVIFLTGKSNSVGLLAVCTKSGLKFPTGVWISTLPPLYGSVYATH